MANQITIEEYFKRKKIPFISVSPNDRDICCPFCETTDINNKLIYYLQIGPTGKGHCHSCKIEVEFSEIIKKLEIGRAHV